ncbi:placenta-specific gene 8 protein-like protein [Lates japonicus]|uniref:Placenta-specific gene 8 protein-like protein n=1 Tax=Lates japonicus TaxID=270547 RepID=A0AAD3QXL0_LATJO|nr:placenta-specific gene 8 protein-like protein [Lates japonicus]
MAACGIPLFVPPAALSLRAAMRNRYGIKMHRELKHRNKNCTVVVNVQPAPVVMVQRNPPPPVVVMNQPGVIMTSY